MRGPASTGRHRMSPEAGRLVQQLHAVAAQHALLEGGYPEPEKASPTGKRVGIVGAGPAGLAAPLSVVVLAGLATVAVADVAVVVHAREGVAAHGAQIGQDVAHSGDGLQQLQQRVGPKLSQDLPLQPPHLAAI